MTCCATSGVSLSTGQPRIAIANNDCPLIAYTSLIAFVAAISPKVNASSTIGIKKSVVLIIAFPLPISLQQHHVYYFLQLTWNQQLDLYLFSVLNTIH
jgi:hypothetical protein